mmetsp:Transcript_32893/g.48019  ORF Transcript_32893/g.48019 Transcript_32893/m.48019 type:complete len:114 (-) Transcript_32893:30-371(-)
MHIDRGQEQLRFFGGAQPVDIEPAEGGDAAGAILSVRVAVLAGMSSGQEQPARTLEQAARCMAAAWGVGRGTSGMSGTYRRGASHTCLYGDAPFYLLPAEACPQQRACTRILE